MTWIGWRWSAPWLDSRLDAIGTDPVVVLAEHIRAVDLLMDEALLCGVASWRQQLRDEGWSGWLLDLDDAAWLVPVQATGRRR